MEHPKVIKERDKQITQARRQIRLTLQEIWTLIAYDDSAFFVTAIKENMLEWYFYDSIFKMLSKKLNKRKNKSRFTN